MKKFTIILIPLFFIIPFFLSAQMETIVIDDPVFSSRSRPPVRFGHVRHMSLAQVSCTDCHHRFENGRNVLDPAELTDENKSIYCRYCHSKPSELQRAYHRLCIRCHQSMVKINRSAGPRLCGECHK